MKQIARYALFCLPFVVALIVYGYVVTLPFFADDVPNFRFLHTLDGLQQWGGSASFPYYRPMVFSVWKLAEIIGQGFSAPLYHALNLVCFGMSGVFVLLIIRRITPQPYAILSGLIAGVGFVIFPFSYQAVTLVSSLFHLLMVLGMVACIWFALVWLDTTHSWALVLAWIWALVAIFSHENGFLLTPLLMAVTFWVVGMPMWRRLVLLWSVPAVLSGVYLVLWATVPRAGVEGGIQLSYDLAYTGSNLLQGLIYPFNAVLGLFVSTTPDPLILLVGVVVIVGIILMGLFWFNRALWGWAVIMLGWYVLSIAPSAILLQPNYVFNSPRLMILASVGAMGFWAIVLKVGWQRQWTRPLSIGLMVLSCAVCGVFLSRRTYDYVRMRDYTNRLLSLLEQSEALEYGLLLVNAPNYVGALPSERVFLTSSESANFMVDEIEYAGYFWVNTGDERYFTMPLAVVSVPVLIRTLSDTFVPYSVYPTDDELLALLRSGQRIIVTDFIGRDFYPVWAGGANMPKNETALVSFDDVAFLTEASATLNPDHNWMDVRLGWQLSTSAPIKRFIHIFCDGEFVGQSDGYVWMDLYPFSRWQVDETQVDIRQIKLSREVDPVCLDVRVGVYNEQTVQRLTATNVQNQAIYPDNAYPVPIRTN